MTRPSAAKTLTLFFRLADKYPVGVLIERECGVSQTPFRACIVRVGLTIDVRDRNRTDAMIEAMRQFEERGK